MMLWIGAFEFCQVIDILTAYYSFVQFHCYKLLLPLHYHGRQRESYSQPIQ